MPEGEGNGQEQNAGTEGAEGGTGTQPTGNEQPSGTEQQPNGGDGSDHLGDPGKKALDAMKAERKQAQEEARQVKQQLEELQAKVDGREAEYQQQLREQQVKDEALSAANERILKAEVRATATGKLADPADALLYMDLSEFKVGSDGAVDAEAISKQIDSLIESKPYLAAQGGKKFEGSGDGGTRTESSQGQLDRDSLKGKSPEQIVAELSEGRYDDVLSMKR